jgi:hypothetical protein
MTEAQTIVADLERRRHEIMQRGAALDADRPRIAYDAMVNDSFLARMRWRSLDEATYKLIEEFELIEAALGEARRRAEVRDAHTVMAELSGGQARGVRAARHRTTRRTCRRGFGRPHRRRQGSPSTR